MTIMLVSAWQISGDSGSSWRLVHRVTGVLNIVFWVWFPCARIGPSEWVSIPVLYFGSSGATVSLVLMAAVVLFVYAAVLGWRVARDSALARRHIVVSLIALALAWLGFFGTAGFIF